MFTPPDVYKQSWLSEKIKQKKHFNQNVYNLPAARK